jgi:hypothetical protein
MPKREEGSLTSKQAVAANALASGLTKLATARLVGVSRPTLDKWCEMPVFQKAMEHQVSIQTEVTDTEISKLREKHLEKESQYFALRLETGSKMLCKLLEKWSTVNIEEIEIKDIPKLVLAADKLISGALARYDLVFGSESKFEIEDDTVREIVITRQVIDAQDING